MADTEFEEFRQYFDQLPQHIKAPAKCYTLAHDITPCEEVAAFEGILPPDSSVVKKLWESPTTSDEEAEEEAFQNIQKLWIGGHRSRNNSGDVIRSSISRPKKAIDAPPSLAPRTTPPNQQPSAVAVEKKTERKRRKLPEIPKIHRDANFVRAPSLAEELSQVNGAVVDEPQTVATRTNEFKPNVYYHQPEEQSPCDSDVWPGTDGDSGNSTVHSPADAPKSVSPYIIRQDEWTPSSTTSSNDQLCAKTDILEATHRGLHRFVPRHSDEIEIDIGDPVYVHNEADDSWCEGVNLRTKLQGIFPSAYVVDVDYADFDPEGGQVRKERFVLQYLGSVETSVHKGEEIICAAVKRIRQVSSMAQAKTCILEISDNGLHVTDKGKSEAHSLPCHDYFFALKNVSFCGFHPTEPQYLGFITKHPNDQRFACHVFQGNGSTRHVAEAIGRAFQRFCRKFIELAYPIHEFYME